MTFPRFIAPPAIILAAALALFPHPARAAQIIVVASDGNPVPTAMVTQSPAEPRDRDTSDNGYQAHGRSAVVDVERTGFTDADGAVAFSAADEREMRYRVRKYGFQDALTTAAGAAGGKLVVKLHAETDPVLLAAAKPSNVWLGALDLGSVEATRHFHMQCGFCHQAGSAFMRVERSAEQWNDIIRRMVRYGSRLPTDLQKVLPQTLPSEWLRVSKNIDALAPAPAWSPALEGVTITEWPVGDAMSQMHDMLIAESGLVYVADNIQDRLHEIDTATNTVTVYRIPHREGERNGGLIAGRLKDFPRHESTSNAHSLAESKRDGHIFITPSAQRRLVEFNPHTKEFTLHEMKSGFYPHTIRVDSQDRVWFTLALSNQVAMFDRKTKDFTLYDLPARGLKEKILTKYMHIIFKLIGWGIPLPNMLAIDWEGTGTPLPYGIDVGVNDTIWFTRLHTKEIGFIDPATGQVTMIPTPFLGPRRLRVDAAGDPWIVAFGESSLARYSVKEKVFKVYPLPVTPVGSEAPYALNVDKARGIVWVNGNQSDAIYGFDVASETWTSIPMPRRTTFTRDIEIAGDGSFYTSNSNFPSWHIEGAQPTLIRVERR